MSTLGLAMIGANGDILRFDGADGYRMAREFGILGIPPVELRSTASSGLVSGSLRGAPRRMASPVPVKIIIDGASPQELYERVERLATAIDPVLPGSARFGRDTRLLVTRPDGSVRQLSARYSTGLDQWQVAVTGQTILERDLLFRADDPHWTELVPDGEAVEFPVTDSGNQDTPFSDPATPFSDPATPFNGFQATAQEGTSVATLTNAGNAETWPLWEITGAATSVEVTNRTTGAVWRWEGNLLGTDELVVDTSDRHPSARLNGANVWNGFADGAKNLFPLIAGENQILVTVLGADTNTTLVCSWLPRWLSA